ncbi:hypothetical protein NKJ48_30635 [Mesorhizobium sp. M0114]|uniref:hypothetical protein n=1 Tax=unclassified Mesorhizobium TaxID=325217 RepID=UPI00333BC8AC
MGWSEFETLAARFRLPTPPITRTGYSHQEPAAGNPPARICEGESRMAELLVHNPERHLNCRFCQVCDMVAVGFAADALSFNALKNAEYVF